MHLQDRIKGPEDISSKEKTFKEILPLIQDPERCQEVIERMVEGLNNNYIDGITGIEARSPEKSLVSSVYLSKGFIPIKKHGNYLEILLVSRTI